MKKIFFFMFVRLNNIYKYFISVFIFLSDTMSDWNSFKSVKHLFLSVRWPTLISSHDLIGIIDCSEIFTETPKNLELQSATWSDYKHHNTLKFLVCVAPNSAITFISKAYTGRISDKAITLKSEFLVIIPRCSSIIAALLSITVLLVAYISLCHLEREVPLKWLHQILIKLCL